jgi:hypothetical protein
MYIMTILPVTVIIYYFPDGPTAEIHQKLKCEKIKDKYLCLYYKGFFINWIILNLHCSFYVT